VRPDASVGDEPGAASQGRNGEAEPHRRALDLVDLLLEEAAVSPSPAAAITAARLLLAAARAPAGHSRREKADRA